MIPIALAVLCGALSVQCLTQLPPTYLLGWVLPLLLVCARFRGARPLAWLLAGFLWAWWQAELRLAEDLPPDLEGRDIVIRGHVSSLPESGDRAIRFTFTATSLQQGTDWIAFTPTLRLSWYNASGLRLGDRWQLHVRLKRRYGFHNPGGFDYEGWLFQQGIAATGYVRAGEAWRDGGVRWQPAQVIRAGHCRWECAIRSVRGSGMCFESPGPAI